MTWWQAWFCTPSKRNPEAEPESKKLDSAIVAFERGEAEQRAQRITQPALAPEEVRAQIPKLPTRPGGGSKAANGGAEGDDAYDIHDNPYDAIDDFGRPLPLKEDAPRGWLGWMPPTAETAMMGATTATRADAMSGSKLAPNGSTAPPPHQSYRRCGGLGGGGGAVSRAAALRRTPNNRAAAARLASPPSAAPAGLGGGVNVATAAILRPGAFSTAARTSMGGATAAAPVSTMAPTLGDRAPSVIDSDAGAYEYEYVYADELEGATVGRSAGNEGGGSSSAYKFEHKHIEGAPDVAAAPAMPPKPPLAPMPASSPAPAPAPALSGARVAGTPVPDAASEYEYVYEDDEDDPRSAAPRGTVPAVPQARPQGAGALLPELMH